MYFVFNRSSSICHTATFLVGAHRFGLSFLKLQTFSEIFSALHIDYSQNEKEILEIFVYLFICLFTTLQRQKYIFVFRNSAVKPQHVLFENKPFLRKMIVSFFSCNVSLYTEKNPVEKLCKVLEMELRKYTPVNLKFGFEKIQFKILHYIQHDFIRERPGLVKITLACSKALLLIISCSNIATHSNGYIKGEKYFFSYKSRCAKCSPETKLFTK